MNSKVYECVRFSPHTTKIFVNITTLKKNKIYERLTILLRSIQSQNTQVEVEETSEKNKMPATIKIQEKNQLIKILGIFIKVGRNISHFT